MASKRNTRGRPKKGSVISKSDFIREKIKAGMSAADVVKAGAASGMKIGTSLIYNVKGRMGATGKRVSRTKPNGKPGPRPKNGGISASDFVRSMPASMKAKDIVAAAKARGIRVAPGIVYIVRSNDKKKGRDASTRRPGAKPRSLTAPGGDLSAFKRMALEVGISTARQALDELERGLAALLG